MALGLILGLAGSVIGSISAHEQAKQEAEIAEQNAKLQQRQMEYNKRMAEREARALELENAENAKRQRQAAEYAQSQRLALLGKSGAAMSSGSPLAVLGAAAADEELAIQDAHYSGARQVGQIRTKATDYAYGAAIAKQNALNAKAAKPTSSDLTWTILGDSAAAAGKALQFFK
jgi:ABC-type transport system involved in cytochrome bd biosynthesis fused ATPase/permease subunit